MSGRRVVASALCLVTSLTLAACSDDPEPRVEPTPSASSTPPDPSPTESSEPSRPPRAGREVVSAWLDAYNAAMLGNPSKLRSASKRCATCHPLVKRIQSIYSNGGYINGGELEVRRLLRVHDMGDQQAWVARVNVAPATYKETASDSEHTLAGGRSAYRLVLDAQGRFVRELYVESL